MGIKYVESAGEQIRKKEKVVTTHHKDLELVRK